MYSLHLDRVTPGQQLAQTLYNERGEVLLAEGTPLTPEFVEGLRRRGVAAVYVRDGLVDDVAPIEMVSAQMRAAIGGNVSHVFAGVALGAQESSGGGAERPVSVDDAVARLGRGELPMGSDGAELVTRLYGDVENLLGEVLERPAASSLESLKSHNAYTFQHSVDVAILGILLGHRAGMPHEQLRELALGCLLHDIGKMYINEAILDKPGKLSPGEFDEIRKHPQLGFELIRRMPIFSILPAHVAYQHHERQDGVGYPRGLSGSNSLAAARTDRRDAKAMLLIAEIAAVADVYSAVSSDRPYRPAMPLDEVASVLAKMAGQHLNREVVRLLRQSLPMYPVGHWVAVTAGPWRGWRGVVTRVSPGALDRPALRLMIDDHGEAVADAVEVDLRTRPDTEISAQPPGVAPVPAAG